MHKQHSSWLLESINGMNVSGRWVGVIGVWVIGEGEVWMCDGVVMVQNIINGTDVGENMDRI